MVPTSNLHQNIFFSLKKLIENVNTQNMFYRSIKKNENENQYLV